MTRVQSTETIHWLHLAEYAIESGMLIFPEGKNFPLNIPDLVQDLNANVDLCYIIYNPKTGTESKKTVFSPDYWIEYSLLREWFDNNILDLTLEEFYLFLERRHPEYLI